MSVLCYQEEGKPSGAHWLPSVPAEVAQEGGSWSPVHAGACPCLLPLQAPSEEQAPSEIGEQLSWANAMFSAKHLFPSLRFFAFSSLHIFWEESPRALSDL